MWLACTLGDSSGSTRWRRSFRCFLLSKSGGGVSRQWDQLAQLAHSVMPLSAMPGLHD